MAQVGNMTEVYIPTKDPVQQKWRCQEWQSMTENMKNSSSVVNGTMIKSLGIVVHTYAWKGLIGLYNKRCTGITEFIHPDINIKEKN